MPGRGPGPTPGATPGPGAAPGATRTRDDEVVRLASDLIRIDTTNTGEESSTVGERAAAEYVATALEDAGVRAEHLEGGARGRANVVARIPGRDPTRGALLVHAHLDVVPAVAADWSVHPLSGEVSGGFLRGRGAVDMKQMVAMTLAVVRGFARDGTVPERDVVLAFLADEEVGGRHGARWIAAHRPDLLDGVTEAVGEVGGFSVTLAGGRRAYLVQTAEKDAAVLRMRVDGTAGHGSLPHGDNAIARLAEAVVRLQRHRFPVTLTPAATDLVRGVERLGGFRYPLDDPVEAERLVGPFARLLGTTLRDSVNVTRFEAGYAANVVPGSARAVADCRILPGRRAAFEHELAALLADVRWELTGLPGAETSFEGALVDRMSAALLAEDPDAVVLPFLLPASTDAKTFHALGIRCFGFAPLRLPADLDHASLFHAVDERVPVEALRFGTRVLARFLAIA